MDFDKKSEIMNLTEKWHELIAQVEEEVFEADQFIDVFKQSFSVCSEYKFSDELPREIVDLLLAMNEYSYEQIWISQEEEASQIITRALCSQMGSLGWLAIDGEFREGWIMVETGYGTNIAYNVSAMTQRSLSGIIPETFFSDDEEDA